MKTLLFTISLLFSFSTFAQIEGALLKDNRKCTTDKFELTSTINGKVLYDIAVDEHGKVTSAVLVSLGTTIKGTPNLMRAKNYAMKLEFEPGTKFPKFHHGIVTITFVKSGDAE